MVIFIFFLALVLLVLVHEAGHFVSAKLLGMKVEEFGFGFPPRIFGIKRGETVYSFNWLPLGGFVRVFGEEGKGRNDPRSYASRLAWQRSIVLLSGVVMNFFLAVVLFWITFIIGFPTVLGGDTSAKATNISVQIVEVATDSPASIAGIKQGDQILHAYEKISGDEKAIMSIEELQRFIQKHKGSIVTLSIKRGENVEKKEIMARLNPPPSEGALGISLASVGLVSFPWHEALLKAIITAGHTFWLILEGIFLFVGNLVWRGKVIGEVSGPVGIASMVGEFYQLGFSYLLTFIGFISINLSVLNALPIPALDGGRLLFIGIEKLKGSPLKEKTEYKIHAVGFALLIALVVLITIRDIMKL